MSQFIWYSLIGTGLFCIGLLGLILQRHLLRCLLSLNIMGVGVFLIYVSLATRAGVLADPVPHAMILTGLVVSVSATALGLVLMQRIQRLHGTPELPEDS